MSLHADGCATRHEELREGYGVHARVHVHAHALPGHNTALRMLRAQKVQRVLGAQRGRSVAPAQSRRAHGRCGATLRPKTRGRRWRRIWAALASQSPTAVASQSLNQSSPSRVRIRVGVRGNGPGGGSGSGSGARPGPGSRLESRVLQEGMERVRKRLVEACLFEPPRGAVSQVGVYHLHRAIAGTAVGAGESP